MRFLPVILCLLIASCSGKPGPIGRGYSSYGEPYKSAPGEKANDVGYAFSVDKNQTVLQDMRFAAQDLAEKLDQQLAFDTDELYITPPPLNAFYKSFDHLLREELIHRGYIFSITPENVTRIDVGVLSKASKCNQSAIIATEGETPYRSAFIELAINTENGVPSDVINGFYEVPLYGYKQSNAYAVKGPDCKQESVTEKIDVAQDVQATELAP